MMTAIVFALVLVVPLMRAAIQLGIAFALAAGGALPVIVGGIAIYYGVNFLLDHIWWVVGIFSFLVFIDIMRSDSPKAKT